MDVALTHDRDHRHWRALGRLLPPQLRRGLERWWGWHCILNARKSGTPRLEVREEARS
jgi:hypothetical protein